MARYWTTQTYYAQPDLETLKRKAESSAAKAKKKGIVYEPVIIGGRNIANTWWGISWCENLERYADYENRIDRGKRYVRNGSVIDLQIEEGKVTARVQGRRPAPYRITVKISRLSEAKIDAIMERCGKRLENIEMLLEGKFPDEMKEVFMEKGGLFPAPNEINFDCSCPDWASMCKHVAAVLYGIGARFDKNPLLFFQLRGIDVERFVDVTIQNRVEDMLANVENKTSRMMDDVDLTKIFGVL